MAAPAPWESAPVVDDAPPPAAPARAPAAGGAAPRAPWEDAPVVGLNGAPPPLPAGTIPGVDPTWAAGQTPAQLEQRQRQTNAAQHPILDKVQGLAEGAVDAATKMISGVAGFPLGLAEAPFTGKPVMDQVGAATNQVAGLLKASPPRAQGLSPGVAGGAAPSTQTGQALSDVFDNVMASLPPILGDEVHAQGAATTAPRAAEAGDEAAAAAARAQTAAPRAEGGLSGAPGTMGSAGAAGTDAAALRRTRAESLPVPIQLTKGGETQDFTQQQFEQETAKSNTPAGQLLRDHASQQNAQVLQNLDALSDLTGGRGADAYDTGSSAVQTLASGAADAKAKAKAAYDAADAAGETADPVPYAGLTQYIEDQSPTTREKLAPIINMVDEQLTKNDPDGTGTVPISALEDIRQSILKNTQYGTPNSVHGGALIGLIDKATENAGGDLYQQARQAWADYAGTYKNRAVVADLLSLRKGTGDRKVDFENVAKRAVYGSGVDDLQHLKSTLLGLGDEGRQTWSDLQRQTIDGIKDEVTSGVQRDAQGNPIVSAAKLNKRITTLDRDGRLDALFGKQGAQHLRDLNDAARDALVPQPGSVNRSGTSSAILNALRDGLSLHVGNVFGVPALAAKGVKALIQMRENSKLTARARDAINAGRELPPGGVPGTPFAPETPAPAEAAPAAQAAAPAVARETPADPRLQEIERLKAAPGASPETIRVLNRESKRINAELAAGKAASGRETEADALEKAANSTFEPAVRQALLARANEMRAQKIPVGDATELPPSTGRAPEAKPLPVGQTREISAEQAAAAAPTRRERDLLRLREETTDPEIHSDLDKEIAAERQRTANERRGREYLRLADSTSDPENRAKLEARARELGAQREQIPAGEAHELEAEHVEPAAEPEELPDRLPDAEHADWLRKWGFGDLDEQAAHDVRQARQYDPQAVERAAQQHERSPVAFGREIGRILEKESAHASEAERPAGGSEGLRGPTGGLRGEGEGPEGGGEAPVGAGGGRPRGPDRPGSGGGQARPRASEEVAPAPAAPAAAAPSGGKHNPADVLPPELVGEAESAIARHPIDENSPPPVSDEQRAQAKKDLAPRLQAANEAKPAFDEKLTAIAHQLGADVMLAKVKGGVRLLEKHALENGGDVTKMRDLVRGSIVVKRVADVPAALQAIRDHFEITRLKDRFSTPLDTGYRDMLINVRLPGGLEGEVQVHIPEMVAAKKLGHKVYDIERRMGAEHPEKLPLKDLQTRIYGEAYARNEGWPASPTSNLLRPEISQAANSPSERRSPSVPTLDSLGKGREEPSRSNARQEPPGSLATGTPSTSKNSAPLGNSKSFIASTSGPSLTDGPAGRTTIASTERGMTIPVRYRVVEAGDLITSHLDDLRPEPRFAQELQPRDRTRDASAAQIARIAGNIKPELMAESAKASDGAPIVGRDGMVESGNARSIALRRAYAAGNAEHYRDWLVSEAQRFGIDGSAVERMKQPVLVRESLGDYDRAEFARQANESPVAAMSEGERARSDSGRMPDLEGLEFDDTGEISFKRSANFVRDFLRTVASPTELGELITSDGRLSQRGQARIRNAVFARAYGDPDLVSMLTEAPDSNVKNVLSGLLRAAPEVAKVRDLADAGARHEAAFVPDLVEAARRYAALRQDGMTVKQSLAQGDMLGGEVPAPVADLMRELEANARAPRRIADMVSRMAGQVDAAGDPRQHGLGLE